MTESEKRCPWCHESGDPSGKGWLVCPRDHTPAHATCVNEFGLCAICRTSLDLRKALAEPSFPEHVSKRAIEHGVFVRPKQGGKRFGIEPLPGSVEAMLSLIARDYRARPINWSGLVFAGAQMAATLAVVGIVFLANPVAAFVVAPVLLIAALLRVAHAITFARGKNKVRTSPGARHLIGDRPSNQAAVNVASELASNDQRAVALARTFREAVAMADRAERELGPLERDIVEIYEEELERTVPIQDARHVKGIGPETVSWLLGKGVATLRDLVLASPALIERLGERRRSAIESWTLDRLDGLARLALSGDFPLKARIDQRVAQERERWQREGEEAGARAATAREALLALAQVRPHARADLDRELAEAAEAQTRRFSEGLRPTRAQGGA